MLKGSYVALVTPFKNNEIDYNSLERLIDFQIENRTDGILLCGTTGESPTIAGDEKERLMRFSIKKINGRIPVMMGTGTNNLHHTISATIKAQEWDVDYALVITPYYNKPTQIGLYQYFKAVAEGTTIPIVIYNVPGRTGINIQAETTIKLAKEFSNIVGIKEASGNLDQLSHIVKYTDKDFSVMSGEDALNLPIMSCGADGVISVTANILPRKVYDLVELCSKDKFNEALKIHQELIEINNALFIETNPIPVKEALHLMKKIERELRLPLCFMENDNLEILNTVLKKYKLV
ncbi:MAG: 4-hydroxy-tetrahydrodipicolinate synthase [Candidatus Tenebribacter burtonii]|jgi:4-hydroxy-tetrahydrodipicolinate synthase|nr:4-hydroxy-tetrahydrodipicolinate synthase [Candidatus Tenebribacter burtonii]